jgi:DNA-directed RNA polymerase specialized sigma24 family protein
MKAFDLLKTWPIDLVSDTPATRAFNAKLVTRADLLRLKVIARLHARGLPPDVSWSDLLQEAFTRVLDGSRVQPEAVPIVAFLSGVMRSIKEQYWRRARKGARQNSKLLAELDAVPAADGDLPDPAPNPERRAIAVQEMDAIHELFADDAPARQIIAGLYVGSTPEEICETYAMSKTDYDSTRRRIRRALVQAGLRFVQP